MIDQKWKIIYYQALTQNSSPVFDFIQDLNPSAKSKVINAIDLLEEFGVRVDPSRAKKLTGTDLWELRILGQDSIRIFYVAVTGKSFLLLHGFLKKKQKTDQKEIKIAINRLIEYKSRPN